MKISARDVFSGKVTDLKTGPVNNQVKVDIGGGNVITSIITTDADTDLGVAICKGVHVVIKAWPRRRRHHDLRDHLAAGDSGMNDRDLVRMANQIADYYRPYPEDEAVAGIAAHIRSFWDPRMRDRLARHVACGGKGLSALAPTAARSLAVFQTV